LSVRYLTKSRIHFSAEVKYCGLIMVLVLLLWSECYCIYFRCSSIRYYRERPPAWRMD